MGIVSNLRLPNYLLEYLDWQGDSQSKTVWLLCNNKEISSAADKADTRASKEVLSKWPQARIQWRARVSTTQRQWQCRRLSLRKMRQCSLLCKSSVRRLTS